MTVFDWNCTCPVCLPRVYPPKPGKGKHRKGDPEAGA